MYGKSRTKTGKKVRKISYENLYMKKIQQILYEKFRTDIRGKTLVDFQLEVCVNKVEQSFPRKILYEKICIEKVKQRSGEKSGYYLLLGKY